MSDRKSSDGRRFTEAARKAAAMARAAKQAASDRFGEPEVYVIRSGDKAFTWELRRFGGVVLQKGDVEFTNRAMAEAAGAEALEALLQTPDLPSFERGLRSRAGGSPEAPRKAPWMYRDDPT